MNTKNNKNKKRVLNVKKSPVYGYLHHAFNLMVAQEHPCFNDWFYSNYIQLRIDPLSYWHNFERFTLFKGAWEYCPLLDFLMINNRIINFKHDDLIDFIINCIDNGYYLWLFIDEYYDPERLSYQNERYEHETFLYGYDLDDKIFHSAGYIKSGDYAFSRISFDDFQKAYEGIENEYPFMVLKPDHNITFQFDPERVKNLLHDYLNEINTLARENWITNTAGESVYGVGVYEYLKLFLKEIGAGKMDSDIRPLHILWEHKKCMTARIQWLVKKTENTRLDSIYKTCREIEETVKGFRFLQIKYMLKPNHEIIERIVTGLDTVRELEVKTLTKLLNSIS